MNVKGSRVYYIGLPKRMSFSCVQVSVATFSSSLTC